ncbi:hypothetical protein L593_03735 [Salinarchaeum sp. Harcht-Bsk1]|nr:hypothetical protein L593_03735 [Salinarchaeum sp. Harcht-Bsk1]
MSDQHKCEACGATFESMDELEVHAREEHGAETDQSA